MVRALLLFILFLPQISSGQGYSSDQHTPYNETFPCDCKSWKNESKKTDSGKAVLVSKHFNKKKSIIVFIYARPYVDTWVDLCTSPSNCKGAKRVRKYSDINNYNVNINYCEQPVDPKDCCGGKVLQEGEVCCGGEVLKNGEECCGDQVLKKGEVCCENTPVKPEECCEGKLLKPKEVCCEGKPVKQEECCKGEVLDPGEVCCDGKVVKVEECCGGKLLKPGEKCCGGKAMKPGEECCGDNIMKPGEECCGDKILKPGEKCCGGMVMKPGEECCSGIILKPGEGCCGGQVMKPGEKCCGGQIMKPGEKCCGNQVMQPNEECCGNEIMKPGDICCGSAILAFGQECCFGKPVKSGGCCQLTSFSLPCCIDEEVLVKDIAKVTFANGSNCIDNVEFNPKTLNPRGLFSTSSIQTVIAASGGSSLQSNITLVNSQNKSKGQWKLDFTKPEGAFKEFMERFGNRGVKECETKGGAPTGIFNFEYSQLCCPNNNTCVKEAEDFAGGISWKYGRSNCHIFWYGLPGVAQADVVYTAGFSIDIKGNGKTTCTDTKKCFTGEAKFEVGGGVGVTLLSGFLSAELQLVVKDLGAKVELCYSPPPKECKAQFSVGQVKIVGSATWWWGFTTESIDYPIFYGWTSPNISVF